MRAFLSVNLDEKLRQEVGWIQNQLKKIEGFRWVNPERMHITLKFLGEITDSQVLELETALQPPPHKLQPFYISFQGIGAFPGEKNPRVLWLGVDQGAEELRKIHAFIQNKLPFQVKKEKRFQPHLTLARRKKNEPLAMDRGVFSENISCANWQYIDRFFLMKSTLHASGPVYQPVKEFFLKS